MLIRSKVTTPIPAAMPAITPVEMPAPGFDVGEGEVESEDTEVLVVVSRGTTVQVEFQLDIHASSLEADSKPFYQYFGYLD